MKKARILVVEDGMAGAVARVAAEIAAWRSSRSYDDDVTLVGIEMGGE